MVPTRVLILGGTSEATALGHELAGRVDIAATMSLAGRTAIPITHPLSTRIGGFGGVDGLVQYLGREAIDVLIDATHPFATQISQNARAAARLAGIRLVTILRPAWVPEEGDDWRNVAGMLEAVAALGEASRRVFLTIGSLQLAAFAMAPQHFYLVRTINPVEPRPDFQDAHFIEARGPFDVEGETRLMQKHRIDLLVTKNSGGAAAIAKLRAARILRIPVILVRRPAHDGEYSDVSTALAAIDRHQVSTRRDV